MVKVSVSEAAWLVQRHERVVRWHLTERGKYARHDGANLTAEKIDGVWTIDSDDLERVPGWHVDLDRLRQLQQRDPHATEALTAKVARLETEIATLRSRMRLLESTRSTGETLAAVGSVARSEANLSEQGAWSSDYTTHTPYTPPVRHDEGPRPFSLTVRGSSQADATLKTHADAARWLMRHTTDLRELSVKSWPGWRDCPLQPRAVLQLAINLCDPTNHRILWRTHRCDDATCVCQELLPD